MIDYANLHDHLPADANRWLRILQSKSVVENAFRTMRASEITDQWLWGEESMREPFVVRGEMAELGVRMPRSDLGVQEVANLVGRETPLEVIGELSQNEWRGGSPRADPTFADCAAQDALAKWTLGQWADYYTDPDRTKVRNVISLEVTESPLGREIVPPAFVRKLDWVTNVWPETERGPGEYPTVLRYCLMSVSVRLSTWGGTGLG